MNQMLQLAGALLFVGVVSSQNYTEKYDSLDLKAVLTNRRLLVPYIKCILDQGKCTAEGKILKGYILEAMQSGCEKCSESQKNGARIVINHLINNEQYYWDQIVQKYDPKKVYVSKYEEEFGIDPDATTTQTTSAD